MLLLAGWFWRDADRFGERRPWVPVAVWPVAVAVLGVVCVVGWIVRTLPWR
jgi:hypothetical protein